MRQQRYAMAIQRGATNSLGVVGAESAAHGHRHGSVGRSEPPDIVPSSAMIDDAVVVLQIGGLLRHTAALHIVRCPGNEPSCPPDPPPDSAPITDPANPN